MKSVDVHPTAVVDKRVELAEGVKVGPYSVIKGKVIVGAGCKIDSHVVIGSDHGAVTIGKNNHFLPGAMIGGPPQDLKFKGEKTRLEVGDNNIFREFTTVNVGTSHGGGTTRLGSNILLMAYVHVAHDCQFGNHIAVANTTNFAGHVTVEDHVRIGGVCSFNQFITLENTRLSPATPRSTRTSCRSPSLRENTRCHGPQFHRHGTRRVFQGRSRQYL